MNHTEILAPAGSMESLTAAVNCGADAVYVGGKNFSARQNAANFDNEELKQAVDFCHLHDVRLHVTVNTIIHDDQLEALEQFIRTAAKAGVDAFIVQDTAAARMIRKTAPEAAVHASTQMSVHTAEGALFLKEQGFDRVVLARELPEKTIEQICGLGIETEVFIHGALCMCLSGQCYLSSMIGQRSANRGLCAQPCRLPYSAFGDPDANALSLKDLSLLKHLIKMQSLGVTSFKIEGRMKRPEYVASAVMACVEALSGETPDISLLRAVFSRNGFTDGYFTGKLNDMFGTREKEDVVAAAKLLPEIRKNYSREIKTSVIHFKADIKKDRPASLTADSSGLTVSVEGDVPAKAIKKPLDADYLSQQLSKLGGTIYEFGGVKADIGDELILSAKSINAMRREAVEKLNELKIKTNTPVYTLGRFEPIRENIPETINQLRVRINDPEQYEPSQRADVIIMPLELILNNKDRLSDISKVIAEPPRFIADEKKVIKDLEVCREMGIKGIMCNNIAYIRIGKELGFGLHGDFSLNISNSVSIDFYKDCGLEDITLSFEMRIKQIAALKKTIPTGIISYGYLPLMLCRNCPIKNEVGCGKCEKCLFDRTGAKNRVLCHNKQYVEILNTAPLYLADRGQEIKNVSFQTLYFTLESPQETAQVIDEYLTEGRRHEKITRGLYYRGVL